jgi:hypothetical protein
VRRDNGGKGQAEKSQTYPSPASGGSSSWTCALTHGGGGGLAGRLFLGWGAGLGAVLGGGAVGAGLVVVLFHEHVGGCL